MIKAVGSQVIVKNAKAYRPKGLVELPDSNQLPLIGEVVAAGPGSVFQMEDGVEASFVPMEVQAGDIIAFMPVHEEIEVDGEKLLVVLEKFIMAVVTEEGLRPCHANFLIGEWIQPTEVKVNGTTLFLPNEYMHGYMNPYTDTPKFEVTGVPRVNDGGFKLGDQVFTHHILDKIPLHLVNYPNRFQIPTSKIVAVLEKE